MFENFQELARKIQNRLPIATSIEASVVCNTARQILAELNPSLTSTIEIISYKNNYLKARSSSSSARNEFTFIKKQLLTTLNSRLPKGPTIKDVRFS